MERNIEPDGDVFLQIDGGKFCGDEEVSGDEVNVLVQERPAS